MPNNSKAKKHPVYWFNDGTLVLQVQDTLYRVHDSLLSRHSPFLASVAKNDHSTSNIPLIEDIDNVIFYVTVSAKVQPKDVEALLQHMYHDIPLDSSSSFEHRTSILRSSSPLQIDIPVLHALAKERLEDFFSQKRGFSLSPQSLNEALAISKEFLIPSIHKFVLYQAMVNLDIEENDETIISTTTNGVSQEQKTFNNTTASSLMQYQLNESDRRLCKRLMTQIIEHFTPILFTPATTPHMACTDVFADTWMSLVIQPAIEDDGVYKPIETLERIKEIDWAKHGLCQSCVREKHEEWSKEQDDVWELVGRWFEQENN